MTTADAIALLDNATKANPFFANVSGVRTFLTQGRCVLKSAETGKGTNLAKKLYQRMVDYMLESPEDHTGACQVLFDACTEAIQKITDSDNGSVAP